MGSNCIVGFSLGLLLVLICMPSTSVATAGVAGGTGNRSFGLKYTHYPQRNSTITVGGSENWRYGFDYSKWAYQNRPFFINDALIFKYDPPNETTHAHSVSLMKDLNSFKKCDFNKSILVATIAQGGGAGFKFVLKESKPYYFACGERAGLHCTTGLMKFFVWPLKPLHRG